VAIWQAALALVALAQAAVAPDGPVAAPPLYVTHNQGLAIRVPRGLTYCPLPADWVGSDHGVTLYLAPPARCGGAGYPSSDRDATPDTPAIDVYYEINTDDYVDHRKCRERVPFQLFGRPARACKRKRDAWIEVEARADYRVGQEPHDLVLTLHTSPERYSADLAAFRSFAKGVRACLPEWADGRQQPCPSAQWF